MIFPVQKGEMRDTIAAHLAQLPPQRRTVVDRDDENSLSTKRFDRLDRRQHTNAVDLAVPKAAVVIRKRQWLTAQASQSAKRPPAKGACAEQDNGNVRRAGDFVELPPESGGHLMRFLREDRCELSCNRNARIMH